MNGPGFRTENARTRHSDAACSLYFTVRDSLDVSTENMALLRACAQASIERPMTLAAAAS